jgi:hypothetical protein
MGLVTRRYPTPTLDGGHAGSTLTVGGVTATVTNLTLTGGTGFAASSPYRYGGGLYNGGTVTLVHVNVVGNTASAPPRVRRRHLQCRYDRAGKPISGERQQLRMNGGGIYNAERQPFAVRRS